jgi:hypothetical protein
VYLEKAERARPCSFLTIIVADGSKRPFALYKDRSIISRFQALLEETGQAEKQSSGLSRYRSIIQNMATREQWLERGCCNLQEINFSGDPQDERPVE